MLNYESTSLLDSIRKDLASFADPRSLVEVNSNGARWEQGRRIMELSFLNWSEETGGLPSVVYVGETFEYRSFFASEHMADLRGLASEIPFLISASASFVGEEYVHPFGSKSPESADDVENCADIINSLCRPAERDSGTELVFLQGRAGDGKSSLLCHIAHSKALEYTRGECDWFYFYVDAQGRALARINEAIALILQDLRSRFTYHGLASLVRLGLLVPIVDGFDELLGAGGYQDAFASLESFIRGLDGMGAVVTSARSTFYQYSALGRAGSRFSDSASGAAIHATPVYLRPWGDQQARKFLELRGIPGRLGASGSADFISIVRAQLREASEEVLSSPFLLTQYASAVEAGSIDWKSGRFLQSVVQALVDRELSAKILDTHGNPILSAADHTRLLGMLAEEMWWQETRLLDEETFLTVATIVCEELNLDASTAKVLLERVPSHAVIARTERPTRIGFRHEYYHAFFLGKFLAREVLAGGLNSDLLSRSKISSVIADEFAWFVGSDADNIGSAIRALILIRGTRANEEMVALNRGSLIAAMLRHAGVPLKGMTIRQAFFESDDLRNTSIKDWNFLSCKFIRTDFRGAKWDGILFEDCFMSLPKISPDCNIRGSGLSLPNDVSGLVWVDGIESEIFEPIAIRRHFEFVGMNVQDDLQLEYTEKQRQVIDKLFVFLRLTKHSVHFSEEDFLNRRRNISEFDDVISICVKSGVVDVAKKQARGMRVIYRLNSDPEDVKRGQSGYFSDSAIAELWRQIRAL